MAMNYPSYLYYPQQYGNYNQPQDPSLIDNNQE